MGVGRRSLPGNDLQQRTKEKRQMTVLRFLGKQSHPNDSPTLYATDHGGFVVQGYIVTDPELLAALDVPGDETVVEVPPGLLRFLAKDGIDGEVVTPEPPIVHVKTDGNYIVQGRRITDPEVLGQMRIPDNETCVAVERSAMAALVGG
jgi:hypothetical protein